MQLVLLPIRLLVILLPKQLATRQPDIQQERLNARRLDLQLETTRLAVHRQCVLF